MATAATKKPRTKKASAEAPTPALIAYKGFDKDLACRGYQYAVGQTFEHKGRVEACSSGFHSCENPWDVLSYYPLGGDNRFAVVKASGTIGRHGSDSKIASATLHIEAELKLPDFITSAIEWTMAATRVAVGVKATGLLTDKGEDGAQIGSSGYDARIDTSGERAVVASSGPGTTAKGALGTWISLAEFKWRNDCYECLGFATGCIGQDGLKPNTVYRAEGGKLVQA